MIRIDSAPFQRGLMKAKRSLMFIVCALSSHIWTETGRREHFDDVIFSYKCARCGEEMVLNTHYYWVELKGGDKS